MSPQEKQIKLTNVDKMKKADIKTWQKKKKKKFAATVLTDYSWLRLWQLCFTSSVGEKL